MYLELANIALVKIRKVNIKLWKKPPYYIPDMCKVTDPRGGGFAKFSMTGGIFG